MSVVHPAGNERRGEFVADVPRQLLAPRWWPAWVGLALLRLIALIPRRALLTFGAGLGWLFGQIVRSRRRIVRTNLRLCFPEWTEAQREQTVNAHFKALGMGLFETLLAWFASDASLTPIVEVEGLEHLHAAAETGGIILLTGHFTTMEMASRLVQIAACRFHGMYRRADNLFADYWIRRLREKAAQMPMVPKDDLKRIVRVLRNGDAVWYGPDQTIESPSAVFAPFFGVQTLTLATTSRLSQMGRASVVPYFPQRIDGRYRIVFEPPLEVVANDQDGADALQMNRLLERAIRRCPEQYFWVHRKFKYRPPGEPDVYARLER